MTQIPDAPFWDIPFLERDIEVERREDGTLVLRNRVQLGEVFPHVPHLLRHSAARDPEHVWLAQRRGPEGEWQTLTYGEARRKVDAITQALLDRGLAGRTLMVLSENSLEHALIELAAMQASMPYVPVTPAYSLRSTDFTKLKAMADVVAPSVLFVQDARAYTAALEALAAPGRLVVAVEGATGDVVSFDELLATPVTEAVEESLGRVGHETVAKYLFTSGSTGIPKAVIVTQGMMATSTTSTVQLFDHGEEAGPGVQVNWLPWSHVAGGTAVFNSILHQGGTLYLDDGRPTPELFGETIRNLREIAPTSFSSMPLGYAMLIEAMDEDPQLARTFFTHLKRATYSGARLPDDTQARLQAHSVAQNGHRIAMVCGYGSTETCAATTYLYWTAEGSGLIGLPQPGIELKLVPIDGERYEVRVRSAAVTPGYLGQPELSAESRDEEGFFKMGDAATFVDPNDVHQGLAFAGRVAEEFKLTSGTFVRVTSLRVAVLDAVAPLLRDVVVVGADRDHVGLLAWPNLEVVGKRFGLYPERGDDPRLCEPLREELKARLTAYNAAYPATSTRVRRVVLLQEPPSQQAGEINDKGYVNQRTSAERRKADVELLFAEPLSPLVIEID